MPYALLVVELQEKEFGELHSSAENFLAKTRGIASSIAPESRLSLGCWQLNLQTQMPHFSTLLRQAIQSRLSYRVTFFEKEPVWCIETPEPDSLN